MKLSHNSIQKINAMFNREAVQIGGRRGIPMERAINLFGFELIEKVKSRNKPMPGYKRHCIWETCPDGVDYDDYLTTGLTFFITPKHGEFITRNGLFEAIRIKDQNKYSDRES